MSAVISPRIQVIESIDEWRSLRRRLRGTVGFVPTMGALHAGHASLLEASRQRDDFTVLSIYVNPTQFNDASDLQNYPNTLEADLQLAHELGVDYVILPKYEDIYADGFRYQVDETEFSKDLCGGDRPGHFKGVLTVVMKLLNIVQPTRAYFGEKDYQQLTLIRDMTKAFFMDVDIVGCPTVRERDGLAMSSRNKHLDREARCLAGQLNKILRCSGSDLEVASELALLGFKVDYVESKQGRRFAAVVIGTGEQQVRLIDNIELQRTN